MPRGAFYAFYWYQIFSLDSVVVYNTKIVKLAPIEAVLHYSVDLFCPLGSWASLWNFETIRGSLMTPKWQKLASLAQKICTLRFQFFGAVFASKEYPLRTYLISLQLVTGTVWRR